MLRLRRALSRDAALPNNPTCVRSANGSGLPWYARRYVFVDVAHVRLGHPIAAREQALANWVRIHVTNHVQRLSDGFVPAQSTPDVVFDDADPVLDDLRLLGQIRLVA